MLRSVASETTEMREEKDQLPPDIAGPIMPLMYSRYLFQRGVTPALCRAGVLCAYLTDVTFWDGGGGDLYYDPEPDMFTGHSIYATFDANGEIGEAEMAG